jgi:tetratricopeptide (TPR) repeat protein
MSSPNENPVPPNNAVVPNAVAANAPVLINVNHPNQHHAIHPFLIPLADALGIPENMLQPRRLAPTKEVLTPGDAFHEIFEQAQVHLRNGKYEEAINNYLFYLEVCTTPRERSLAYADISSSHSNLKDYISAIKYLNLTIAEHLKYCAEKRCNPIRTYYNRMIDLLSLNKQYEESLKLIADRNRDDRRFRDDPVYKVMKAKLLHLSGKYEECFEACVSAKESYDASENEDIEEEVVQFANSSLKSDPGIEQKALLTLTHVNKSLTMEKNALLFLGVLNLIYVVPRHANVKLWFLQLADKKLELEDWKGSEKYYRCFLAENESELVEELKSKNKLVGLTGVALSNFGAKNWNVAKDYALKALSVDPLSWANLFLAAKVCFSLHNFQESLSFLNRIDPSFLILEITELKQKVEKSLFQEKQKKRQLEEEKLKEKHKFESALYEDEEDLDGDNKPKKKKQRIDAGKAMFYVNENLKELLNIAKGKSVNCIICETLVRAVRFQCGHVCLCQTCSSQVQTCPICRAAISVRDPVFLS